MQHIMRHSELWAPTPAGPCRLPRLFWCTFAFSRPCPRLQERQQQHEQQLAEEEERQARRAGAKAASRAAAAAHQLGARAPGAKL